SEIEQKSWAAAQQQAALENLALAHKSQIEKLEGRIAEEQNRARERAAEIERLQSQLRLREERVEAVTAELRQTERTAVDRALEIKEAYGLRIADLERQLAPNCNRKGKILCAARSSGWFMKSRSEIRFCRTATTSWSGSKPRRMRCASVLPRWKARRARRRRLSTPRASACASSFRRRSRCFRRRSARKNGPTPSARPSCAPSKRTSGARSKRCAKSWRKTRGKTRRRRSDAMSLSSTKSRWTPRRATTVTRPRFRRRGAGRAVSAGSGAGSRRDSTDGRRSAKSSPRSPPEA